MEEARWASWRACRSQRKQTASEKVREPFGKACRWRSQRQRTEQRTEQRAKERCQELHLEVLCFVLYFDTNERSVYNARCISLYTTLTFLHKKYVRHRKKSVCRSTNHADSSGCSKWRPSQAMCKRSTTSRRCQGGVGYWGLAMKPLRLLTCQMRGTSTAGPTSMFTAARVLKSAPATKRTIEAADS